MKGKRGKKWFGKGMAKGREKRLVDGKVKGRKGLGSNGTEGGLAKEGMGMEKEREKGKGREG